MLLVFLLVIVSGAANAQIDEICGEAGATPGLDSPFAHVPYVYGRVTLKGVEANAKRPKVVVFLTEGQRTAGRWDVDKSGNYCFKRAGSGGELRIEVDGTEVTRRTLPSFGSAQQREDFEIEVNSSRKVPPVIVVASKFSYPRNDKTADLYAKAAAAEAAKDLANVIEHLKQIVAIDPADFIAWAKLGTVYFQQDKLAEADAAFRRSIEQKVDYTPAWITVGQLRAAQKQYPAAIQIFLHAIELEPASARAYQLMGEAYLLNKQGTLGAEALNQAIKLDPVGMVECHLQLAHLYELAGAKKLATHEYKTFLEKVPDHKDRKKFEKFIQENPE